MKNGKSRYKIIVLLVYVDIIVDLIREKGFKIIINIEVKIFFVVEFRVKFLIFKDDVKVILLRFILKFDDRFYSICGGVLSLIEMKKFEDIIFFFVKKVFFDDVKMKKFFDSSSDFLLKFDIYWKIIFVVNNKKSLFFLFGVRNFFVKEKKVDNVRNEEN